MSRSTYPLAFEQILFLIIFFLMHLKFDWVSKQKAALPEGLNVKQENETIFGFR